MLRRSIGGIQKCRIQGERYLLANRPLLNTPQITYKRLYVPLALVSWYKGYEEKGEVKDDGREKKKISLVYSEDHIHAAVSFYIEDRKSPGKECLSDFCSFWYVHDDSRYGVALF